MRKSLLCLASVVFAVPVSAHALMLQPLPGNFSVYYSYAYQKVDESTKTPSGSGVGISGELGLPTTLFPLFPQAAPGSMSTDDFGFRSSGRLRALFVLPPRSFPLFQIFACKSPLADTNTVKRMAEALAHAQSTHQRLTPILAEHVSR